MTHATPVVMTNGHALLRSVVSPSGSRGLLAATTARYRLSPPPTTVHYTRSGLGPDTLSLLIGTFFLTKNTFSLSSSLSYFTPFPMKGMMGVGS